MRRWGCSNSKMCQKSSLLWVFLSFDHVIAFVCFHWLMNSFSIFVGLDFSLALGGLQNQFGFGVNYLLYGYYITKNTGIELICVGKLCRSVLITIRNTLDYIFRPARKIFRFAPKNFSFLPFGNHLGLRRFMWIRIKSPDRSLDDSQSDGLITSGFNLGSDWIPNVFAFFLAASCSPFTFVTICTFGSTDCILFTFWCAVWKNRSCWWLAT